MNENNNRALDLEENRDMKNRVCWKVWKPSSRWLIGSENRHTPPHQRQAVRPSGLAIIPTPVAGPQGSPDV